MSDFSELIRSFDKIRDYMRDFYIYGFKLRSDFKQKSARTYDNEKRRIESYMRNYMKWDYSKKGKTSFISMDSSKIPVNTLYAAWKSKTFTSNDIMLHFYIFDALHCYSNLSADELTDQICIQSGKYFDVQIVRHKCNEYVKNGILTVEKNKKTYFYRISNITFESLLAKAPKLIEVVKFFQGSAPFGEIGSFILDNESASNEHYIFKHNYVAHTLEDGILLDLLSAIRNNQGIEFINFSERTKHETVFLGIPLKIFISATTGRRYICIYKEEGRRFFNYRLDHIKSVKITNHYPDAQKLCNKLDQNLDKIWGVSFGGRSRIEIVCMKLYINEEKETYILDRIKREGHNGELIRLDQNIYLYTKEMFDTNDIAPWIKTFIGRIIQLEGTNTTVINRFYNDMKRMKEMYHL